MPLTRREWLIMTSGAAWSWANTGRSQELPVSGDVSPGPRLLDEFFVKFLVEHQAPGCGVAVLRGDRLLYARGFGWADRETWRPVEAKAWFRLASVSKPITAVALLQLIEAGHCGLDDRWLELVPEYAAELGDPRMRDVTLRQLLQHTAGWDRGMSGDPIAKPNDIRADLGLDGPPRPEDVLRWTMQRPLDFGPGERMAYSNVGYLALGRVIAKLRGVPYSAAIERHVLQPLGIRDMALGRARPADRPPQEVRYYDHADRTGASLYAPDDGRTVPLPDGAENLEGYEAHGGWIASATAVARFVADFADPAQSRLLKPETIAAMWARPEGRAGWTTEGTPTETYYGCGWSVRPVGDGRVNAWHSGLISGTSTIAVRRWDGLSWAILFNCDRSRTRDERLSTLIDGPMHAAVDAVTEW